MGIHYADRIYVVTATRGRGETLQSSVSLRGFDRVKCLSFDSAISAIREHLPDLLLIDCEGNKNLGLYFLESLAPLNPSSQKIPILFLADTFDEDYFLTCYDAGARDFLVKPVNNAYLVSRVLIALDESRLKEKLAQRDAILKDLSVIGQETNVFATEYFLKNLKRSVENNQSDDRMSLLIVQIDDLDKQTLLQPGMKKKVYQYVADVLKRCSRGADTIGEFFEDRFAVILPDTDLRGGQSLANRVLDQLNGATVAVEPNFSLTLKVSVGMSEFQRGNTLEELMQQAEASLRQARLEETTTRLI